MRTLAGLHRPAAGRVSLDGRDVTGWPAERMVAHGLSLVPEGRQVFGELPVIDNLRLGAYRSRADKAGVSADLAQVLELFPALADRRGQLAGTLSGGEQPMLAIGRGLMSRPRVLLLDEPSLGLAPLAVAEVVHRLADLVERGVTILLVEQNARAALRVCSRGYVVASGEIVASGATDALLDDPAVRAAYLGAAADPNAQIDGTTAPSAVDAEPLSDGDVRGV
ncbi:ABC transporter ATP-binding protein [soil metagenome]